MQWRCCSLVLSHRHNVDEGDHKMKDVQCIHDGHANWMEYHIDWLVPRILSTNQIDMIFHPISMAIINILMALSQTCGISVTDTLETLQSCHNSLKSSPTWYNFCSTSSYLNINLHRTLPKFQSADLYRTAPKIPHGCLTSHFRGLWLVGLQWLRLQENLLPCKTVLCCINQLPSRFIDLTLDISFFIAAATIIGSNFLHWTISSQYKGAFLPFARIPIVELGQPHECLIIITDV